MVLIEKSRSFVEVQWSSFKGIDPIIPLIWPISLYMKEQKKGLSLRYKLLILLTSLPLLSLSLYLWMAIQLFEKDKVAYVFDSSVAVSRSLATQIRVEVDSFISRVRPILESFNYHEKKFSEESWSLLDRDARLEGLSLFQGEKKTYTHLGDLARPDSPGQKFLKNKNFVKNMKLRAISRSIALWGYEDEKKYLVVAQRIGDVEDEKHLVLVALYEAEDLVKAFTESVLYRSFLLEADGRVALGSSHLTGTPLEGINFQEFFSPILGGNTPEGTAEVSAPSGDEALISYSEVSVGDLLVASVVDKGAALKAVEVLVAKSLLFFAALLASTLIISVFASIQMTSTLRELYEATKKIAQGHFDIRVKSRSRDEVGGLAHSFNWMAEEVSRLMSETAEKARMENELATVKTVQETLFPSEGFDHESVRISGHFEPASECGGDWWSYSHIGDKVYLWIGDATGHGAPAALITSAARSAAAIVETLPDIEPSRALEIMNRAIHETSKGKIMMTFFLGVLDLNTGVLVYANASHDPPYLIRPQNNKALTKRDLVPLMDEVGPRLGDGKAGAYKQVSVNLEPGDILFFYTDGVMDVQNSSGKAWGERSFIKSLLQALGGCDEPKESLETLKASIGEYREESDLIDDVTFFICQYRKSHQQKEAA